MPEFLRSFVKCAAMLVLMCGISGWNTLAGAESDADAALNSGIFEPYVTFPVGSCAQATAIGDVNDDGRNDVVVATTDNDDPDNDHRVHVFLQNDSGALVKSAKYPVSPAVWVYHPRSIDIGDMNNDGRNDVVVAASNGIGVLLQNDSGTLDPMAYYASTHTSHTNTLRIGVGDFNNDDLMDAVSIDWGTQSHAVEVYLQNAGGTLDPPVIYQVEHGGYDDLDVGDVNNNGLDDIIVMSGQYYAWDNIGILIQNDQGTFDAPAYYDLGDDVNSNGVAVGDVNGDGRNDVVLTYYLNIGVFLQNKSGTLNPSISYPMPGDAKPIEIGDVNCDGLDDVVTGGGSTIEVLLQDAGGTLLPYERYDIPYETHYERHAMSIGDIDSDGRNDVVIANCGAGLVVLYGACKMPPIPDLKANGSDGPLSVGPDTAVTITASLDPVSYAGQRCDWWVYAETPSGTYWLTRSRQWRRSDLPIRVGGFGLFEFSGVSLFNGSLPAGDYSIYFILDDQPNSAFDAWPWLDYVQVNVSQ